MKLQSVGIRRGWARRRRRERTQEASSQGRIGAVTR